MTIIYLKNIIIDSKDYEEEFVRAQLSVISEERVKRETEEKIARQHAIEQLRWKSELNILRLEIESIRSNVRRLSCAEDRKTSSNYRISIGRAEEHARCVVPMSKNLVNDMLICSSDYEGLIENSQLIRNPAKLREPSKEEGIINSTDSKSVCSQEVVTDLRPETYTVY
ncbi:hypothetical protein TNCV_1304691 [Trichonephila clavipes]|nr:hypothetical protein TNCV_1304691 [Trichonephila clavipes]